MKEFKITKYFSGYCSYKIMAKNEELAYKKAKNLPADQVEIINTLEEWEEANEIEVIENDRK
jgi:hypothetical protein